MPALRLGLRMVKGLNEEVGKRIEACRPFRDAGDLARRADLNSQTLRFLARAGALNTLAGHRYQAHWEVAGIQPALPIEPLPIEPSPVEQPPAEAATSPGPEVQLAAPAPAANMFDDYRYTSLTLGPHPMRLLRSDPQLSGYRTAADLESCRHGQMVSVAGLVTGRQRPSSASGVLFVTLEDETGNVNVVVWTSVLGRFRAALLQGQLLRIKGVVEREKEVIHVVAGHIEDNTQLLQQMAEAGATGTPFKSRDFK
jgi:error-prone DNA polymerase